MKPTWDHRAVVLLILIWYILNLTCMASPYNATTTSSDLKRRQCVFNVASNDWDCDLFLPTLAQLEFRFRDVSDQGKATADNIAW